MIKDWNHERRRTRDRLLEYDFRLWPAAPHSAGLPLIYPWENFSATALSNQILALAQAHGYDGDEETFWNRFGEGNVIHGKLADFPVPGDSRYLYFDEETEVLYYFKATTALLYPDDAAQVGIAIVGKARLREKEEIVQYLYIPIRSLPIEETILYGGDASEYTG